MSKAKLPAILGWLITGMIFGPYALNLLPDALIEAFWYEVVMEILECAAGLMIGTELILNKLKRYGKALIVTTLWQSLGTFVFVSLCFGIVFYFADLPVYLAFIYGGIALATAPAPALSIVREFKTKGPVTSTLIPMAALDDMVGVTVFFVTISLVARQLSGGAVSLLLVPVMILLPLVIGGVVGFFTGMILKKITPGVMSNLVLIIGILITALIGRYFNHNVMPSPLLNFMLMGMAFAMVFSNMIPYEKVEAISGKFNPFLSVAMLLVIINLGAPLDYHAILGAGIYTMIYIVSRAIGKYGGARIGATLTGMDDSVRKFLGFTLLPHSGVSLVFTGIAVSVIGKSAPDYAQILSGTIAAAAIINEIIAVIMAKKGFEWAKEL